MADMLSRNETIYDKYPSTFLFHKRFRRLCRERGLSVKDASEAFEVHRNTICAWNAGTKLPKMHHLVAISRTFDVTCDYMCGMDFFEKAEAYAAANGLAAH